MNTLENLKKNMGIIAIIVVFVIVTVYTIGFFTVVPYPGIRLDFETGGVAAIYDETQFDKIQMNDTVLSVNEVLLADYDENKTIQIWRDIAVGEEIPIVILRDGEEQTIQWRFPGRTKAELTDRLVSQWFLSFLFLIMGALIYDTIRPRDQLWLSLLVFSLSAAVWNALGSGPSRYNLWGGAVLVRVITWLMVISLLHFTLVFPRPFKRVPQQTLKWIIRVLYLIAGFFMALELITPGHDTFMIGTTIGLLAALAFVLLHFIFQKETRSQIILIVRFFIIAILPVASISLLDFLGVPINVKYTGGFILSLPLIPASLLFAIWKGDVSHTHFRANQVLSGYLFFLLLITISIPLVSWLSDEHNQISIVGAMGLVIMFGIGPTFFFRPFQKFVEKVILRVPVPFTELLQTYSQYLNITQDTARISTVMGELILPALLVRQSLLVELQAQSHIKVMDSRGVSEMQIPTASQVQRLINMGTTILPNQITRKLGPQMNWVRVVIPLTFDQELIGAWLLGRRDPNDQYDVQTVETLKALAQQTTIAIINHQRSTRLRLLYEVNIARSESERASLARDLHDDTLNDLALLQRESKDPNMVSRLQAVTSSLRKVIQGLRPEMISYGLETALYDLGDTINEREGYEAIQVKLKASPVSLPENTELHIFRIVQQACENAIHHAQADSITIEGDIRTPHIEIQVVDNGIGFDDRITHDLQKLIEENHYGVAGMVERADLINAQLEIDTAPGQGTKITLTWPKNNKTSSPTIVGK